MTHTGRKHNEKKESTLLCRWDTPFWNACVSGGKHWVVFPKNLHQTVPSHVLYEWSEITNHAFLHDVYPLPFSYFSSVS